MGIVDFCFFFFLGFEREGGMVLGSWEVWDAWEKKGRDV